VPPEHRELLERMFRDLRQMVPEHVEFEILDDGWKFTNNRLWSVSTFVDWMTLYDLAEKVLSDLQDFMADTESVWWPMVGSKRLAYRIDCLDGRPELVLTL
jgi:hypothetical protein